MVPVIFRVSVELSSVVIFERDMPPNIFALFHSLAYYNLTICHYDYLSRWDNSYLDDSISKYMKNARMFAFVARKIGSRTENTCHIFAELEPEQPATAVVNFITKVMMGRR